MSIMYIVAYDDMQMPKQIIKIFSVHFRLKIRHANFWINSRKQMICLLLPFIIIIESTRHTFYIFIATLFRHSGKNWTRPEKAK